MSEKTEKNTLKEAVTENPNHLNLDVQKKHQYQGVPVPEDEPVPEPRPVNHLHPLGTHAFHLPSGSQVIIMPGKGKDARIAMDMAGKETDKYMNCLMSLTVTVDGRSPTPEEFDEMPLNDFMKIQAKFSELNFL